MLRTNLSTRPFYNVRVVQLVIAGLTLLVLLVTLFNVLQIRRLSASQSTLGARATASENEAARLRGEAAQARAQIDPKELAVVAAAAREANGIIDRRAFSWTALLGQFERTLPPDVRITSVQPRLEVNGTFVVSLTAEGRRVEDIDNFVEALESDGSFRNVLPHEEQTTEEGLIEAVIEGVYAPDNEVSPGGEAAGSVASAGDGGQP